MKVVLLCAALALSFVCGGEASLRSNLLSLHLPSQEPQGDAPWFCHDLDCPEYTVVNKTDDYEVREYKGGQWAATEVDGSGFTVAMTRGFARLFQYISGDNEEKQKIKMTTPVAMRIRTEPVFAKTTNNYTIAFWVPEILQGRAPKPTSDDVRVVDAPKMTVYVGQFGGFATEDSLLKKAAELAGAAKADGVELNTDGLIWAGYDPPYRLTGRHNEVSLLPKEAEDMF
jgi:hypothetical protein